MGSASPNEAPPVDARAASSPRPGRDFLLFLGWWCACRLPFFLPRADFFDSPEYIWHVHGGFWSGVRNAGAHIPFQGTVYGPAGFLYAQFGGALPELWCIALIALLYGALAYLALLVLWRRFAPRPVFLAAAALYPLLAGPALSDLSTYSTSASLASLFGGTALLAEGLAREPSRRSARAFRVGAALCFGFSIYTHLIAALWPAIPAAVVIAFVAGAPALRSHRALPPLRARLVEAATWGALAPAIAAAIALLLAGHDIERVGLAPSALAGAKKLILRDGGLHGLDLARAVRSLRDQSLLVTGGLGGLFAVAGALRWARREGGWAWASLGLLLASIVLAGNQHVWGMPGRLHLPMAAIAVPAMAGAVLFGESRSAHRWSAVLALLLFLQTGATFLHVMVSRRTGPHPNEAMTSSSARLPRSDLLIVHPGNRTFSAAGSSFLWDGDDQRVDALETAWSAAEGAGGKLWTSSEALRYSALLFDGHLRSICHLRSPDQLSSLERFTAKRAALVVDAPLGRAEFLAELMRPSLAPDLGERVLRARAHLRPDSGLLIGAIEGPSPFLLRAFGGPRDCVSGDRYDAFELTAWMQVWKRGCDPLQRAAPDASGLGLRPVPGRSRYELLFGLEGARPTAVTFEQRDFEPLEFVQVASALGRAKRPFVAVLLETGAPAQMRLALRELALPR